jgi:hypothetical protein
MAGPAPYFVNQFLAERADGIAHGILATHEAKF